LPDAGQKLPPVAGRDASYRGGAEAGTDVDEPLAGRDLHDVKKAVGSEKSAHFEGTQGAASTSEREPGVAVPLFGARNPRQKLSGKGDPWRG
jgi:hypothetical protein